MTEQKIQKMWRADTQLWLPIEVECPHGLYPHEDADGMKIYANTHFKTKAEAMDKLLGEAEAWVCISDRDLSQARKNLQIIESECEKAHKALIAMRDLFSKQGNT